MASITKNQSNKQQKKVSHSNYLRVLPKQSLNPQCKTSSWVSTTSLDSYIKLAPLSIICYCQFSHKSYQLTMYKKNLGDTLDCHHFLFWQHKDCSQCVRKILVNYNNTTATHRQVSYCRYYQTLLRSFRYFDLPGQQINYSSDMS